MEKCSAVRDMIVPYIENDLEQSMRNEVEEHIGQCELCRAELYDIKQVMELCADMPNEELPEDFHRQLHERLVGISSEQAGEASLKKSRLAFINSRYLKVCSSIAAVLILAVLLKGLFPSTKIHDQSATSNMRQFNASGSESNPEDDAGVAMLPGASLYGAENGESNTNGNLEDASGKEASGKSAGGKAADGSDTGSYEQDKPVQAPAKKKEEQKAADKYASKGNIEHEKTQRSLKEERSACREGKEESKKEACLREVDLVLKVDDPESGKEEARTYIADFGGLLADTEAIGKQEISGSAEPADTGGSPEGIGSGKLAFEMPHVQYSSFVEKLGNAFGQDSLVVGEIKSVDVKDQLDSLEGKLSDLNDKKALFDEQATTEEVVKIEAEIYYAQLELDDLKNGLNNISVMLSVEKKDAAGDAYDEKQPDPEASASP